jgi:hypothetical protein
LHPDAANAIDDATAVRANAGSSALLNLAGNNVARGAMIDVSRYRERSRQQRLRRLVAALGLLAGWMWFRILTNRSPWPTIAKPSPDVMQLLPAFILVVVLGIALLVPLAFAGKSPHVRYAPSEITVSFDDVVGLGVVREEVVKTLNLFLGYKTFRDIMGGNPRKAILFEGPPGTGKTHMAKAMAREAGVPYLFVSSTAFQSMYYGQTGRKIRNFFKELRKAAREEGGAIGFIEEIDAIAGARSGMRATEAPSDLRTSVNRATSEGISGVVNELLIQLQSFDTPTFSDRMKGAFIDRVNKWLPDRRKLKKRPPDSSNILVIGATNRAADPTPRCCDRAASTGRSTSTCRAVRAGARSSTTTSTRRRTSPSSTRRNAATSSPR